MTERDGGRASPGSLAAAGGPRFTIRRLVPDEAALFRALRLEALERHPEAFGASLEDEAAQPDSWFAARLEAGIVLAGWLPGMEAPAGLMALALPRAEKTRHKGLLWSVYLRPEARGHGLAPALLSAVLAEARGRVEEVRLSVVAGNDRARRLYERAGFTAWGLEPRALKLGGRYYDEVLMRFRFPGG